VTSRNAVRSGADRVELDDTDHTILDLLTADARMPNSEVAARVGLAPSTCLLRTRRLVSAGVIRGFHARVDPAALGLTLQAVIAIRLQPSARRALGEFGARLAALPGVRNVFFLAGADDFQVHVAAATPEDLREFVVRHLSAAPEVASTETALVFEHIEVDGLPTGPRS
jgi:DNA-binding Lrp family transcriptional regulator